MFAGIESIARRWRRRLSRSEWAIRHLGLTPSEGTSEEPGLLLIQIDGFARTQLERALEHRRMPFLRRLIRREGYELRTFYPGIPSTTPAVQAELYYGVKSAVPAFSFFDRKRGQLGRMYDSDWAKALEAECAAHAEGLLTGGSSWSNIYTGGARQDESHFCAASIGLGDMWRTGKIRNIFLFIVFHLPSALRIAWLLLVEFGVAVWDAVTGIFHGRKPGLELTLLISRVFIGVGLRELLIISGQIDVTRGLPIVHINFVGYDEQAHARGPGSRFAHWSLRGIDRAIKHLVRAAHRSNRRDYAVWIFSDHGQEHTRPFPLVYEGGLEAAVRECLALSRQHDRAWQRRVPERPVDAWLSRSERRRERLQRQREASQPPVEAAAGGRLVVADMGPVGHIYFPTSLTDEQRHAVARRLVDQFHVPGVLLRRSDESIVWLHARGETRIPDELPSLLPQSPALAQEITTDLVRFCGHRDAGDLIATGWVPWDVPWSFAAEHGAHGGFGPEESRGFVLLPARTRLPLDAAEFVRPTALRAAARHYLGREILPRAIVTRGTELRLRVMTYNTHGCSGMDGRVSPRRIARVVGAHDPDIVALQELDLGRRRSRAEDQAALVAKELGLHVVFCPTITRGEEHYGHALLSRWPIEVVKRALLPADPKSWWREPRSAVWARVHIGNVAVNVVTTHLGLGPRERFLQMRALLGPEWLGPVIEAEPVLICGDFNLSPGSAPYRLAARSLRDVQTICPDHHPLKTFSSLHPFMRIDHVFVSRHFAASHVFVPRNELTRLASDHLPLVADLEAAPATVETSTHTPR